MIGPKELSKKSVSSVDYDFQSGLMLSFISILFWIENFSAEAHVASLDHESSLKFLFLHQVPTDRDPLKQACRVKRNEGT